MAGHSEFFIITHPLLFMDKWLRYVSSVKALNYKQYGVTHKIVSSKRIKLQGISGTLPVNSLDQFNTQDLELANFKHLDTPRG